MSDKDDNYRRTALDDYFEFLGCFMLFLGILWLFDIDLKAIDLYITNTFNIPDNKFVTALKVITFFAIPIIMRWLLVQIVGFVAMAIGSGIRGVIKGWGRFSAMAIWRHQTYAFGGLIICFGIIGAIISLIVGIYDLFDGKMTDAKASILTGLVQIPLSTIAIVSIYAVLIWIYKSVMKWIDGIFIKPQQEQTNKMSRRIIANTIQILLMVFLFFCRIFCNCVNPFATRNVLA
jgi:hypothetical protein